METERLEFRKWQKEDAKALYEYASNPSIADGCGWPVHESQEESLRVIGELLMIEEYGFALDLKETKSLIGTIDLTLDKRGEDEKRQEKSGEIGCWIGEEHWGNGYMPEAVRKILAFGFETLGLEVIYYAFFDWNKNSRRVAEKIGFKQDRFLGNIELQLTKKRTNEYIFKMTKEDWQKNTK